MVASPTPDRGERQWGGWVQMRMNSPLVSLRGPARRLGGAVAATLLLAACANTGSTSTTVIQPPTPPGLPKAPAIRIPNPPGAPEPPQVGTLVRVEKNPPAGSAEPAPTAAPFAGAVWQPGYYAWENNQYVWQAGRWEKPPEGRTTWIAPRWEPRHGGWVFVPGQWQ